MTHHLKKSWDVYATGALLALGCAVYLAHAYSYNFISDDSFITLRYARNLAEGHGLVFNPNERVEGFTSPLWTILLAGMHLLGCDLLLSARSLGLTIGLVTLFLAHRLVLISSDRRVPPLIAALVPLTLASNGSYACWAASGMDTMLYVGLVVASVLTVLSGGLMLSAFLVTALVFTRPEGAAVLGVLSLCVFLQRRKHGMERTLLWLMTCCGAMGGLFSLRYLYYGEWFPNTYYAKTGGGLQAIGRGMVYLVQYAGDHEGLIFMMLPVIYGILAGNLKLRFVALTVICLWLGTIMVGGDGLPMYRFALGPLPLLLALQASMMVSLYDMVKTAAENRWRTHAASVAVAFLITVNATKPMLGSHYELYEYQNGVEIPRWTQVGKWLRENARVGESVATVPIGAVAYYSGLVVYDMLGVTDAHVAHREMPDMGKGWAGHEKHDGQYILGRKPTYLLAGNIDVTARPRDPLKTPFLPYLNRAIWDREKDLYDTTLITTMYEPRSAEIAPGQFLNFYELRDEDRPTLNGE
ncbi:MAG TPA: hypothetical protein VGK94_15340 [Candidatus Polarisedimenticolia bacterium]